MSFLDILLQTPIFQGVSRASLTNSLEKYNIEFLKYHPGDQMIQKGELFTHVKFIISGKLVNYTENKCASLKIKEILGAPNVIAGNYVFGLETRSIFDVYAHTDVGLMQLKKEDFLDLLRKDPIFNLNYLNFLSLRSQNHYHTMLALSTGEVKERLAMWVLLLTRKRAEEIVFQISLTDMAKLLGDTRDNLVTALNELKRMGLLVYSESEIKVTDRHGLADFIHDVDDAE